MDASLTRLRPNHRSIDWLRVSVILLATAAVTVPWHTQIGCFAFSSPPLPRGSTATATTSATASFLVQPPQQTTSRRQFQEKQGDDNDKNDGMYDGGEIYDAASYYDGEYDFDLFDDASSSTSASSSIPTDEKRTKKKTLNDELNRWFEDRNQIQPILLTDLLHQDQHDDDDDDDDDSDHEQPPPLIPVEDFVWFEPTLREIELKYDERREQLQLSLHNDRLSTPRTVPLEANDVLVQVLQEEMEDEIRNVLHDMRLERKARKKERKRLLRQQQKKEQDDAKEELLAKAKRELQMTNPTSDPILANAAAADLDDKAKLMRKQSLYVAAQAVPTNAESTDSLDYWAMDRVEESLLKQRMGNKRNRQQAIEEKLKAMRERMERKVRGDTSRSGSKSGTVSAFQPDDYADWKKYQEIKAVEKAKSVDGIVDEGVVRQKLIDYKEFMARQELTLQAFHEEEEEVQHELEAMRQYIPPERKQKPRNFSDVVSDINRKALKSLEQVLEKRRSVDGEGTKELEERIAKLRESLEAVNYVDVKFAPRRKKQKVFKDEPIDFTDVFPSQAAKLKGEPEPTDQRNQSAGKKRSKRSQEFADLDLTLGDALPLRQPQEPIFDYRETPANFYYSSDDDASEFDDDDIEEEIIAPLPPPKTAFFSSLLDADNSNTPEDDVSAYIMSESDINKPAELRSTSLLGTFEEQRLKNLYRQAGAATEEEQERLRTSMEEFQRYQEEMMRKYEEMDESDLGYDIADVLTEDGDIDSEKVLSYIKAKPVLSQSVVAEKSPAVTETSTGYASPVTSSISTAAVPIKEQSAAVRTPIVEATAENVNRSSSTLTAPASSTVLTAPDEIVEVKSPPAFLGVSDINSPPEQRDTSLLGTYEEQRIRNLIRETGLKDKEEQEKFKDDFEKFQQYQQEAMNKFEEEEEKLAAAKVSVSVEAQPSIDVPTPLSEVLFAPSVSEDQSMVEFGPTPSAAERKRRLAQGAAWKPQQEVVVASNPERGSFLGQMEVGIEAAEETENDEDDEETEEDFEENKRRIEQALGVRRSNGIDIYDALGRRPGEVDYDEDYKRDEYAFPLRRNDVDLSSYQSRKAMMLERKSISIMEVNSLMDMKDNLEVEGISPYMARVNKPFKEFGAIFRLEGVLVDISALEFRAWYRVAANVNMKPPSQEDVRLASVQNAEYAVSRIFHWTNDYLLCREIAGIHSRFLKEEVEAALNMSSAEVSLDLKEPTDTKVTVEFETPDSLESNVIDHRSEQLDLTKSMYIVFAEKYGFRRPTEAELEIALQLSPRTAVEDVFEWPSERNSVESLVSALKQVYESERIKLNKFKQSRIKKEAIVKNDSPDLQVGDDLHLTVTDGAISWIKALLDVEMPCGVISYLDAESVDLIMKKTGLASLIPPEKRVTSSSGYDRDTFQQLGSCLRIDRRPDMCVVFDGNADALNAARDNEMKSVGMTCVYPSYELLAADMTARNFDYLTAMNVRRLFGGRENQEPLLQVAMQEPSRPKRKLMTMYPDDERPDESDDEDYRVYNEDVDRYYGDDKYAPRRSVPTDGVIYDEKNDSDLFQ